MERTDFEQWKAKEVARLLALVETERRYYQEMVAALPVALVVLSGERSIVSANRAFRQTFGVRTDELRHRTIEQILPSPELVEKIREIHVQGTGLTASAHPQISVSSADGRPWRVAIVPIRNWDEESELETLLMIEEAGANIGVSLARTVTPPASVDGIPAILWQADASTLTFTSVVGAVEDILGYSAWHWLNTPQFFRDRIHPEDRPATMNFYEAAFTREGDASAEFRAVAASGATVWCRETIRVTEKRIVSGVITDITLRKQLEQQLLTAGRSDALSTLSSRLAHDLNNPLMIIAGYGEEVLESLPKEDSKRGDVQQILEATDRISGITGQLLSFTRRLANPARPVNLAVIMHGLEEKISLGEGVALTVEPQNTPIWAAADPVQIEDVILALSSSAREDARERSRVTIYTAIEEVVEQVPGATLKPGFYTTITIRDNGRGMDAAQRDRIFESIVVKDDHAANAALARAYTLVREWGGDIAFSSEPFRGSTFTIYLPHHEPDVIAVEPLPEAEPEPVPAPLPEPPAEQLRETILLVDDEPGIRALVRKILRRERYVVLEAGSAEEALNVAAAYEGRISLLITDVMLPGMSGRELAQGMREALPELRILYVSGYSTDESVRSGAFPPGSQFLQKPFTLSALVGKVGESLADD